MKKIYALLHDERVQGTLIIVSVFAIVLTIMVLTWGK